MHYHAVTLLEELQADVRSMILQAGQLKRIPSEQLLRAPAAGKWTVAQVLEHLNAYGRFYLPAITASLQTGKAAVPVFKPGILGDYFTRIMKPGANGQIGHKMSAPEAYHPAVPAQALPVITAFTDQQQALLLLLEQAKAKNIGAIRTPISISRFIRLKTGDTFRFLVAHEQRHFLQIRNTLKELGVAPY